MSDARTFLIAAYVVAAVTLVVYAIRLVLRARAVERRLAAVQDGATALGDSRADPDRSFERELVGTSHVQA